MCKSFASHFEPNIKITGTDRQFSVSIFCFIIFWHKVAKFLHNSCARSFVLFYYILLQMGEPLCTVSSRAGQPVSAIAVTGVQSNATPSHIFPRLRVAYVISGYRCVWKWLHLQTYKYICFVCFNPVLPSECATSPSYLLLLLMQCQRTLQCL